MDTAFEKQSYMDHALIWSGSIGGEENAECVVPDNMPDIGAIVDTDAAVLLRSKELANGRLNVQADIAVKILYQPEGESALRSLSVSMSASLTAAADTQDDGMVFVSLRARSAEGKMLNSRKAAVRVELAGTGYCYARKTLEIASSVASCDCAVEMLCNQQTAWLISDVREKTFILTDDLALPGGLDDVQTILTQRVSLQIDETEFVGDKLVFRGRAFTFLLLGHEGGVYPCSYESRFSQIMEVSAETKALPEIALAFTGIYFDLPDHSGGKLGMELHLLAQVVCRCETELSCISDAYSNQRLLEGEFSENVVCQAQRDVTLRHSVTVAPDNAHEIGEVLFCKGTIGSVTVGAEGAGVSLSLRCVYRRSDGSYGCVSRRVQEAIPIEAQENETLFVTDAAVTNVSLVRSGGMELCAQVELKLRAQRLSTLRHLSGVEFAAERLPDSPSLTLLRCAGEEQLWQLAKTHRSTREAILAANDGRCEGMLLIPKCR